MKTAKRDTRYIIKRILIGVGIALILANLRKCNVYADTTNNIYLKSYGMGYYNIISDTSFTNYYDLYNFNYSYNNMSFDFNIQSDTSLTDKKYVIFHKKNSDIYVYNYLINNNYNSSFDDLYYTSNSCGYGICPSFKSSSNTYENGFFGGFSILPINISNNEVINYMYQSSYSTSYDLSNLNNNYDIKLISWNNELSFPINNSNFFNDFEIVSSNFNNIYYENNIIYSGPPDINNFSEINISDNQAVYFLPKNYNDIQIESVQTGGSSDFPLYTNYIDFNYYFIGSVKDGYFPVNNLSDLTFKNVLFSSPPSALYVDSYFPMYQGGDDRSGYQYYSYIIFNNYDSDTTIYYNGTLFNAFIIEDIENYNETNCFIDRDNNNFCIAFDFQNEVNNAWLKGFITDDDFVGNQENEEKNLSNIFDKLKIPFTWFKSLTTYTCSNISLPIPFVNNSITLNCLSSKFHQILGDNFYNIIFIIINGLYAYRITILNIDSITDSLDPNDDKLEVIDL